MTKNISEIKEYYMKVKEYLDTLIIGEEHAKTVIALALLSTKNCRMLMSGKPGTDKTTLSNSIAKNFKSKKIFMTSDLLPIDILNTIKNGGEPDVLQFEELNRSSDKAQSSLIEILGSNEITIDGVGTKFKEFYVMATQNDTEVSGIFNTPQAVYDRFDVNLRFGSINEDELEQILFEFRHNVTEAKFDLNHMCDITSKAIDEFEYSKEDRKVLMQAYKIIRTAKYNDEDLFASSNIRGFQFSNRIAALNSIVQNRISKSTSWILPSDLGDYISNIFLHRINQAVLKMHSPEAQREMDKISSDILSLRREKKQR